MGKRPKSGRLLHTVNNSSLCCYASARGRGKVQSKRGLATCPPVPQSQATTGKERTGSATHVLLRVLCSADCTVSAWPVSNLLTIFTSARKVAVTRSLPCSSWKHAHTPLSACDCAWPPSASRSLLPVPHPCPAAGSPPAWSPDPPAGALVRRGAHGTDQDGVLRCPTHAQVE